MFFWSEEEKKKKGKGREKLTRLLESVCECVVLLACTSKQTCWGQVRK